jgi:hypothetical protein
MATKLKLTLEFSNTIGHPDDGNENQSKIVWDSKTGQVMTEGILFPWMLKALIDFQEKVKNQT